MRYVAAYCLLALGGKTPTAKDLKKLLDTVGVDYDAGEAEKVVSELDGKDLEELISEGMGKLGSMPVASAGGGGAAAAAADAEAPAAEAKKEEEPEEESDDDMGFGLFD